MLEKEQLCQQVARQRAKKQVLFSIISLSMAEASKEADFEV